MSWHFSQALVEAYSEGDCSDGGVSAPSKSAPMLAEFSSLGKMTAHLSPSPYGTIYAPLQNGIVKCGRWLRRLGACGKISSSAEDSPVKTSALRARGGVSKVKKAAFGPRWRGLSVRYDRHTCGWRTHHCLLDEALDWCSLTLPRWGMMRDGELWERIMWERPMRVNDFGYTLPTPKASDWLKWVRYKKKNVLSPTYGTHVSSVPYWTTVQYGKIPSAELICWLMGWPTTWGHLKPLETGKFQQWLRKHGKH